ncbi:hypothetical protein AVEN_89656-1 [Araneus ventricosus]|uniref:Uncharacterized protein n=1 Tax=Araneus ventricosus TaxID=182803 RepID=A0A4Y2ETX8_ARAVE|nr:hypothetical protein AVEN_89656-1 [Araneus ventricosus]
MLIIYILESALLAVMTIVGIVTKFMQRKISIDFMKGNRKNRIVNTTHPHLAEVLPGWPLDEQVSLLDDVTHRKSDGRTVLKFDGHHITAPIAQVPQKND